MATKEMKKLKEKESLKEVPKTAIETVSNKPSLTHSIDVSSNPIIQSSAKITVTVEPLKEGEDSKEKVSPKVESPLSSPSGSDPVSDLQKKMRRAERFGMPVRLSEEEKKNSRAERFGTGSTLQGTDAMKKSEEQKRKARAERFGLPSQSSANEEAKKKARLARFGTVLKNDTLEEDKKKERAIRFSQPPSSASSQANGKASSEQKKDTVDRPVEEPEH